MQQDTIPVPHPVPPPKLAPGVIRVEGIITEIHALSNHHGGRFKLKIIQLLGMGAAAPAATPGDTLNVKIENPFPSIKKDNLFVMQLKHRQVLSKFEDTTPAWLYIKGKKLKGKTNR